MLRASVSSIDITPEPGPVLQGHWSLNRSHRVLLPLKLQSLVLECGSRRAAIITVDAIGVSREQTRTIRTLIAEKSSIPGDNVMVCASHTHSAPAVLPIISQQPDERFVGSIIEGALKCVLQAQASLEPVRIGLGCGVGHFNVNRRPLPGTIAMFPNDAAVIDHRARVLKLERLDGRALAVLFHFACHPTTKSGSEGLISPDYPGAARDCIERELGCTAMFIPGCFANIRPRVLDEMNQFRSASEDEVRDCGEALGRSVVRAARSIRCDEASELASVNETISMPFAEVLSAEELDKKLHDDSLIGVNVNAPWAKRVRALIDSRRLPRSEDSFMQAMRIGPVALVTIPGEPALEIGMAIERSALQSRADLHDVWSVGYTNDMLGYLCTARHHDEGGYEPNAFVYFDRPATFRDEEQVLLDGANRLLTSLR